MNLVQISISKPMETTVLFVWQHMEGIWSVLGLCKMYCNVTDGIRYLIEHGAKVNEEDDDGATALHLAVQNGHVEVVKQLLQSNADVNQTRANGGTPLLSAVRENQL